MPFDWREFLVVAHELGMDEREGAQRTSLGRAYYYAYNSGLAGARSLGFTGDMPGLHKKLWTWCRNQTNHIFKQIGVEGARMYSLRIEADYKDAPIANLAREVQKQLDRARHVETLLAQDSGHVPPTA